MDGYDEIEVASLDSFPASDPPGWIEAKARPCTEEGEPDQADAANDDGLRQTTRRAKRAAKR